MELKPCPKCGGEVEIYIRCGIELNYNYMAKCQECRIGYPLPGVKLKTNGEGIDKAGVRKAIRIWNNKVFKEDK